MVLSKNTSACINIAKCSVYFRIITLLECVDEPNWYENMPCCNKSNYTIHTTTHFSNVSISYQTNTHWLTECYTFSNTYCKIINCSQTKWLHRVWFSQEIGSSDYTGHERLSLEVCFHVQRSRPQEPPLVFPEECCYASTAWSGFLQWMLTQMVLQITPPPPPPPPCSICSSTLSAS